MTQEEAEHNLRVLVELVLYREINIIKEGKLVDERKAVLETINSFEKRLPDWAKQIPNYHDIIMDTLRKTQNEMKKIKQKEKKQKSLGEER